MPIFDKTIVLTGKHGYYADVLKERGFFNRIIDVYMNAPVVGFMYNRKVDKDKSEEFKDSEKKIFMEQVTKENTSLEFIYRLILLLDSQESMELDDRINRAFRVDSLNDISDQHLENLKLFNSYVLGGIEVLYEKIISKGAVDMDFITNAYAFMKEQTISQSTPSPDDYLKSL